MLKQNVDAIYGNRVWCGGVLQVTGRAGLVEIAEGQAHGEDAAGMRKITHE
jgi:hypothetical protein